MEWNSALSSGRATASWKRAERFNALLFALVWTQAGWME